VSGCPVVRWRDLVLYGTSAEIESLISEATEQ
jgi:hypothetical protein